MPMGSSIFAAALFKCYAHSKTCGNPIILLMLLPMTICSKEISIKILAKLWNSRQCKKLFFFCLPIRTLLPLCETRTQKAIAMQPTHNYWWKSFDLGLSLSQMHPIFSYVCLNLKFCGRSHWKKIRFVWINGKWKWMNQAQKSGYYVSIFFWIALGRLVFRDGCKFGAAESNILWPRFQKKVLRQKISHLLLISSARMLE